MKGQFKSLSQINTATVPIVLIMIHPLRWNQVSSVKNISFWVNITVICCLQKAGTKMCSSFLIAFFNYPVLFYMAIDESILSSIFLVYENPTEHTFSATLKSFIHKHQDTYDKVIFYMIYRIPVSHYYHIERGSNTVCVAGHVMVIS
jgi:hypothetical protein